MTEWTPQWLEAEGDLGPWRDRIAAEIEAGRQAMARLLPLTRIDILVQRLAGQVIPETGTGGFALRKGLFSLTVDPDNPNFAESLRNGDLRRSTVHEAHHCMRMGGPGYGVTLGEALVSEGLAGCFVRHLWDSAPEPWERAVDDAVLRTHWPSAETLWAPAYDHAGWFFGTDPGRPRWLGYALGHRIVAGRLAVGLAIDGLDWVNIPARTVLAGVTAIPRGNV